MATQTLQSSSPVADRLLRLHPEDLLTRAEYLTELLQWIECARTTLDQLEDWRRLIPQLDAHLKERNIGHPMDWTRLESGALQELHMIQADAIKVAKLMIDNRQTWPGLEAKAQ